MIRKVIGNRLQTVGGTFHVYDGTVSHEPIALWFGFEAIVPLRFAGASDGWHLVLDDAPPEEVDMHSAGAIHYIDTAMTVSGAIGATVRRAWLVVSPSPRDVIGVRFDFDAMTVRVLNWGDQMYLGSDFPRDADLAEIAEVPV
jgi:hypothetical protein